MEQWPDSSDQQGDTCLPCKEVYLTDLRYGHRALRFIEAPPSQEERDTKQVAISPTIVVRSRGKADTTPPMESNGMPSASLTKSVQF